MSGTATGEAPSPALGRAVPQRVTLRRRLEIAAGFALVAPPTVAAVVVAATLSPAVLGGAFAPDAAVAFAPLLGPVALAALATSWLIGALPAALVGLLSAEAVVSTPPRRGDAPLVAALGGLATLPVPAFHLSGEPPTLAGGAVFGFFLLAGGGAALFARNRLRRSPPHSASLTPPGRTPGADARPGRLP